jgi:hypothetical protein
VYCPFCTTLVEDDAQTCPECAAPLAPGVERYAPALQILRDATSRVASLTAERAGDLVAHLTGAIQQMLDTARDDLDRNFRRLAATDTAGDADIGGFIETFAEVQREINEALGDFGRILTRTRDPRDLEGSRRALDEVSERISSAVARLAMLDAESGDPLLASPAVEPLPPEVPRSLESIARAMGELDRYIADRDVEGLEACLAHLDAARGPLAALRDAIRAEADAVASA